MSSWRPTGFSAGEFARMQQDAERRVEEMRRRARQSAGEPEEPAPCLRRSRQPGRGSPCPWRLLWPGCCDERAGKRLVLFRAAVIQYR